MFLDRTEGRGCGETPFDRLRDKTDVDVGCPELVLQKFKAAATGMPIEYRLP
jgi:hypothetical protein